MREIVPLGDLTFPLNLFLLRVDSTERLAALRRELSKMEVSAFLVPTSDSHQSEYVAPRDNRLKWVSGFSGKGFGVVTTDKAALWTDGR